MSPRRRRLLRPKLGGVVWRVLVVVGSRPSTGVAHVADTQW
jgi:hypothetical protein